MWNVVTFKCCYFILFVFVLKITLLPLLFFVFIQEYLKHRSLLHNSMQFKAIPLIVNLIIWINIPQRSKMCCLCISWETVLIRQKLFTGNKTCQNSVSQWCGLEYNNKKYEINILQMFCLAIVMTVWLINPMRL